MIDAAVASSAIEIPGYIYRRVNSTRYLKLFTLFALISRKICRFSLAFPCNLAEDQIIPFRFDIRERSASRKNLWKRCEVNLIRTKSNRNVT